MGDKMKILLFLAVEVVQDEIKAKIVRLGR